MCIRDRLLTLASQPERVFARKTLTERIWGYPDLECAHLVDVHVGRLRMKLRAASPDREYVVTELGEGYRLTGDAARSRSAL